VHVRRKVLGEAEKASQDGDVSHWKNEKQFPRRIVKKIIPRSESQGQAM
jgi:hypothetical protein